MKNCCALEVFSHRKNLENVNFYQNKKYGWKIVAHRHFFPTEKTSKISIFTKIKNMDENCCASAIFPTEKTSKMSIFQKNKKFGWKVFFAHRKYFPTEKTSKMSIFTKIKNMDEKLLRIGIFFPQKKPRKYQFLPNKKYGWKLLRIGNLSHRKNLENVNFSKK